MGHPLDPVVVESHHVVDDEPSWRDDKYHDHKGFFLTEQPSHVVEETHVVDEPYHQPLNLSLGHHLEYEHEDGVENFDNERLHRSFLQ